jgi:predicted enzyme related to lactoylglutathione lyase
MLQGLRTTIYATADLAQAAAWYGSLLGLAPYFNQPYYVGFNVGGYELGLVPDGDGATTYWGTADIEAEMKRVLAIGASLHSPIKEVGEGIRVASVKDPFGNIVGMIENPHFKLPDEREAAR